MTTRSGPSHIYLCIPSMQALRDLPPDFFRLGERVLGQDHTALAASGSMLMKLS